MAIRVTVQDVPPFEAAAIRFFLAALLLVFVAAVQRRKWPNDRQQWKALMVLSLTMMAVPYGLLFWAEQYVASSLTAVMFSAMPLLVALLTPLMGHRPVARRAVFAMVLAFGGLLVILYKDPNTSTQALLGYGAILFAVFLSSWSVVYAKDRLHDVDSVVATGLQLLFGSVALGWATWAMESHRHAVWSRPAVLAMAFLTVFGSCAAFVIYYWLLKKMQPYQLSTTSLIVPVVAVLEGALILREPAPWWMIVAIGVVLGAVATVLLARNEPEISGDEQGRVLMVEGPGK